MTTRINLYGNELEATKVTETKDGNFLKGLLKYEIETATIGINDLKHKIKDATDILEYIEQLEGGIKVTVDQRDFLEKELNSFRNEALEMLGDIQKNIDNAEGSVEEGNSNLSDAASSFEEAQSGFYYARQNFDELDRYLYEKTAQIIKEMREMYAEPKAVLEGE